MRYTGRSAIQWANWAAVCTAKCAKIENAMSKSIAGIVYGRHTIACDTQTCAIFRWNCRFAVDWELGTICGVVCAMLARYGQRAFDCNTAESSITAGGSRDQRLLWHHRRRFGCGGGSAQSTASTCAHGHGISAQWNRIFGYC